MRSIGSDRRKYQADGYCDHQQIRPARGVVSGIDTRILSRWRIDVRDKPIAGTGHGFDEFGAVCVVLEGCTNLMDTAGQRIVGNERPSPHCGDDVVFRNQVTGIFQQIAQYVERFRLEPDDVAVARKYAVLYDQVVCTKAVAI